MRLCIDTWKKIIPHPIASPAATSPGMPGQASGMAVLVAMVSEPATSGMRTPMRSEMRPAYTASRSWKTGKVAPMSPTSNELAP